MNRRTFIAAFPAIAAVSALGDQSSYAQLLSTTTEEGLCSATIAAPLEGIGIFVPSWASSDGALVRIDQSAGSWIVRIAGEVFRLPESVTGLNPEFVRELAMQMIERPRTAQMVRFVEVDGAP